MLSLVLLLACGDRDDGPKVTMETRPNQEGLHIDVRDPTMPLRPDGNEPLVVSEHTSLPVEGLDALPLEQRDLALKALNGVPGPCQPCMSQGVSLADCLLQAPEGCDNIPVVAKRVVRLVEQGLSEKELGRALMGQPWFPIDPTGWPALSEGPIPVVAVVDYADPFSGAGQKIWSQLAQDERAGVVVLLWSNPARPEGELASKAAWAAHQQGGFAEMHAALISQVEAPSEAALLALASEQGLDADRFRADLNSSEARLFLRDQRALALELGVRSSPTTFIDGYRLRGARPLKDHEALLDQAQLDREL